MFLEVHKKSRTPLPLFYYIAKPLVEHPLGWGCFEVVDSVEQGSITVVLTPSGTLHDLFPEFKHHNLSVCDMVSRNIWINEDRWHGAAVNESKLPLNAYRAYVLQHELGHALGKMHYSGESHSNELSPVMLQQTLGIGSFISNPFPREDEKK